jgi:hypothetical protein
MAFMTRCPLIGRQTTPNINSWRHVVVTQMRRENGISSLLTKNSQTNKSALPEAIEYTGSAAGAPAAPLSDSFRLGCILENDESQKIFRDFSAMFPGVQMVTQTGVRRHLFHVISLAHRAESNGTIPSCDI